jgi:hypothetical protein
VHFSEIVTRFDLGIKHPRSFESEAVILIKVFPNLGKPNKVFSIIPYIPSFENTTTHATFLKHN